MQRSMWIILATAPALIGIGLILNGMLFSGVVLLFIGAGLGLADFRWATADGAPRRLIAKGSPALLMVALMLGAAKGYVATKDAVLPILSAQAACAWEDGTGLLIVRALDVLR